MFKNTLLFFIVFISFGVFHIASAEVFLNEVQISGVTTSDEFVELYNSGSNSVDLTDWYINKKSSTGSESTLVAKSRFEGKSIPASSYLLLGREEHYAGSVTPDIYWPSSYSLASNNSLILYRGSDTNRDEISWSEITDGNSFQKQSTGSWKEALPTPRAENTSIVSTDNTNSTNTNSNDANTSTNTGNATSTSSSTTQENIVKTSTKIIAPSFVFVNSQSKFTANTMMPNGPNPIYGKYIWNFGDGSGAELPAYIGNAVPHTYFYTGEYTVTLEYYSSENKTIPDAVDKRVIKVLSSDVVISRVGDEKDFFIEITNNTEEVIDISSWVLSSSMKNFIFPKNTSIEVKKSILLSPYITNFNFTDKDTLKLFNKENQIVFDFGATLLPKELESTPAGVGQKVNRSVSLANTYTSTNTTPSSIEEENDFESNYLDSSEDISLEAEAIKTIGDNKVLKNYNYFLFLILIIGLGIGSVYFVRKNKISKEVKEDGEDFEILDE